ncbi:prnB Proline-specific permease [Candida maltosa Xu316]|uniref:Proline-specific permease, putative n=1 Tax=Candida maltosa (strain Xu316) TaxID=1245528 RepID=M3HH88_CANMX|nr:Proline-specific permease, putative [Candida maltosa Xu316]
MSKKVESVSVTIDESSGDVLQTKEFNDFKNTLDIEKYGTTKRLLKNYQVGLLMIGQSIGSALFVSIKNPLNTSGSLSFFLAFAIWACLVIYPLMQAIGEMCSYLPIKGSFFHFSARYVDPALGFASSLIYIYTALMFVCIEATACAGLISFWTDLNPGIFITIALVLFVFINLFGAQYYGNLESLFSFFKVILILGLMLFSLISMCGGNPHHNAYGFQHWKEGGLFKPYLVGGSTGKFLGLYNCLIWAGFAAGGPDVLALIAGEVKLPRKNIGIAAKRSYIRIYLFYLGGIFFLNCLIASNDPALVASLHSSTVSPWTLGMQNVGVRGLASVVNGAVLTSAFSCGNAFFFLATRSLYSASLGGYVPRIFSKCLNSGVPIYCVLFTALVSLISYLSIGESTGVVFNWFINLATTGLLCSYICMWLAYFKFRKAYVAQTGQALKKGEYKYYLAPRLIHPYFTYLGFFINVVVLFFNGFWIFFPGQFSVSNLFTSYFGPVFFIFLFFFWKIYKKTTWRSDLDADIISDKQEIDDEEEADMEYEATRERNQGWVYVVCRKVTNFCFG